MTAIAERLRVLLIGGDPDAARLTRMKLRGSEEIGDVHIVSRIADLDADRLASVDCVLLDLNLPEATGLEGLLYLRDLSPDLPVIVIIGADESSGIQAVQLGAQDYLLKDHVQSENLHRAVVYAVERNRLRAELARQALHDALTGLPNRMLFMDRLGHALSDVNRGRGSVAVLYLDLDHFKEVNDSLGHAAGDDVIMLAANRLVSSTRTSDTVARLGGDEFAVLCTDVYDPMEIEALVRRIHAAFGPPFPIDDAFMYVGVSIGVALSDSSGVDPTVVVRDADTALYEAKETGRNRVVWFDSALHARAMERLSVLNELGMAIENGGLRVAYQPIIDLTDGKRVAFEALVRWDHPIRGMLLPGDFSIAFQKPTMALAIDRYVLKEALQELSTRWDGGWSDAKVGVNVSEFSAIEPSFSDDVLHILDEARVPCDALMLEVHESAVLDQRAADGLNRLRSEGVHVALDDFGAGSSSLSHFLSFSADVLKLDRGLVQAADRDTRHRPLLELLLRAADESGMSVITEGVETQECADMLAGLGVRYAQGFLWGQPVVSGTG
ncbi:MAG: putative bifunctional diguanylate cyclase/phosphodiesterase [Actinomycetota bacterium]